MAIDWGGGCGRRDSIAPFYVPLTPTILVACPGALNEALCAREMLMFAISLYYSNLLGLQSGSPQGTARIPSKINMQLIQTLLKYWRIWSQRVTLNISLNDSIHCRWPPCNTPRITCCQLKRIWRLREVTTTGIPKDLHQSNKMGRESGSQARE